MAKKKATKAKSTTKASKSKKGDDRKLFAFLSTFFTIIGVLLVIILDKRDDYIRFYAKQGIVLFIFWLIVAILGNIPFFGWALWILFIVVWVMSWINALSGEKRSTFLIGDLAEKIKF